MMLTLLENGLMVEANDITGFDKKQLDRKDLSNPYKCKQYADVRISGSGGLDYLHTETFNYFLNFEEYNGYTINYPPDEEVTHSINTHDVFKEESDTEYLHIGKGKNKIFFRVDTNRHYAHEVFRRELAFRKKKKEYYQILFENRNY